MSKVWWVETGSYSDYAVLGVYSTKENADLAAAQQGGSVVEVELDENIQRWKLGERFYQVFMERDGRSAISNLPSGNPRAPILYPFRPGWGGAAPCKSYLIVSGWFRSRQQAVKATNEMRAEMIATNAWPPDPPNARRASWRDAEELVEDA